MSDERIIRIRPGRILPAPDWESIRIVSGNAFDGYVRAVGNVAHASNSLHEELAELFATIVGAERRISLAIWYSSDSDRVQREMLRAAVISSGMKRWLPRLPTAQEDILWMLNEANKFANRRNNAIHAPCSIVVDTKITADIIASKTSGHQRAKNLQGKDILIEFDWCAGTFSVFEEFTYNAERSLASEHFPWPKRPVLPDRKPKTSLQGPPPRERPK